MEGKCMLKIFYEIQRIQKENFIRIRDIEQAEQTEHRVREM